MIGATSLLADVGTEDAASLGNYTIVKGVCVNSFVSKALVGHRLSHGRSSMLRPSCVMGERRHACFRPPQYKFHV